MLLVHRCKNQRGRNATNKLVLDGFELANLLIVRTAGLFGVIVRTEDLIFENRDLLPQIVTLVHDSCEFLAHIR